MRITSPTNRKPYAIVVIVIGIANNSDDILIIPILRYSYILETCHSDMQINKRFACKITAISALVAVLTTIGSGIPSMALQERFDRDTLIGIIEDHEDQAKGLAENTCVSFLRAAGILDTDLVEDLCNIES
jgi:hypothetical protein